MFTQNGSQNFLSSQTTISLEEQTKDAIQEIKQLKADKEVLESKIKAYHKLGQLFLEKKSEVDELQKNKNALVDRIKELEETIENLLQKQKPTENRNYSSLGIQTSFHLLQSFPNNIPRMSNMCSLENGHTVGPVTNGDANSKIVSHSAIDARYLENIGTAGSAQDKDLPPSSLFASGGDLRNISPSDKSNAKPIRSKVNGSPTISSKDRSLDSIVIPNSNESRGSTSSSDFQLISNDEDLILFSHDHPSVTYPPQHDKIQINIENIGQTLNLLTHELSSHSNAQEDTIVDGPVQNLRSLLQEKIYPTIAQIEEEVTEKQNKIDEVLKENAALRSENLSLNQKLEKLVQQQDKNTESRSLEGWKIVEKNDFQKGTIQSSKADSNNQVASLKQEIEKLRDANQRWNLFHDKLSHQHKENIKSLRQELEKVNHNLQLQLKETTSALEETKLLFAEEKNQVNKQQEKIHELNMQLNELRMEQNHHCMECVISGMHRQRNSAAKISSNDFPAVRKTRFELEQEMEALQQQITVFQEDFAQERNDRAKAYSDIEDLKTERENLKRKIKQLEESLTKLKKKLSSAEANLRQTTSYNQKLNEEKESYKKELLREKEKHQRVIQEYNQIKQTLQRAFSPKSPAENFSPGPFANAAMKPGRISQPQTDPCAIPTPSYLTGTKKGPNKPAIKPMSNLAQNMDEQLPGAWTCAKCTLKNHPSRTVCEICGNMRLMRDLEEDEDEESPSSSVLFQRGNNEDKIVKG